MNNKPVRLHKKEPITIEYNNKTAVYITGFIFILILLLIAFSLGSDNYNFLLAKCI